MLALPAILVLAIAMAIELRAWPFFVQTRVGEGGGALRFLKLRTLPPSAPCYASKYALSSVEIPALARRLRELHLDELPQLFLVLAGKMSLVGPRPEMAVIAESAGNPTFAAQRASVLPGCAGLWQASTAASGLIWESPEYDLFYLAHASVRLDAWILWRTLRVMLRLGPPITLADVPAWTLARRTVPGTSRLDLTGALVDLTHTSADAAA